MGHRDLTISREDIKRFHSKYTRKDRQSCWEWLAAINSSGYGSFCLGSTIVGAHRVSYMIAKGKIVDCILHRCNNRRCVNPHHLYDGSRRDNALDAIRAGTHYRLPKGSRSPNAKLSSSTVSTIRRLASKGKSYRVISETTGVPNYTISLIVNRKTYNGS